MNIPYINIGTNNGSIQVADNIYNGQAAATKVAEAELCLETPCMSRFSITIK